MVGAAAVVLVAGVAGATVAGMRWHARGAPERALAELAAAVRTRDTATVERAVDLRAFSQQIVDEAIAIMKVETLRDDGAGALGVAVGSDAIDKMAPTVARSFEMSLRQSLSKTADSAAEHTPAMLEPLVRLSQGLGGGLPVYGAAADSAALAGSQTGDGIEWRGFGETRFRGDTALVPITVRDRELPNPVTLTVRLVKRDEAWTVVALDRVGDVLVNIRDQRKRILDDYNARVLERLDEMLEVGPVRRSMTSDYYGINTWVTLRSAVTNRSDTPVEKMFFYTRSADGALDDDITYVELGDNGPVAPGKTATVTEIINYNRFIDWHATVRFGDLERLKPQPIYAVRITATGKDTVQRAATWYEYARRELHRR